MIYKISYFKKELRQAYGENKVSTHRKISFALFLGLISFAIYFVLQSLQESVLAEVLPEVMQPSFFSTVYIYIHLSLILFTAYFIYYYDYLFFSEIRRNSWYLLIQMGYKAREMFFAKLIAQIYSVLIAYTVGFAFVVFLTFLLKYTFIFAYLPSLYIVGLFDLMFMTILAMTFSLFAKTIVNARYSILFSLIWIFLLKALLGQYDVISNRVEMQNLLNLFDLGKSLYFLISGILLVTALVNCYFRARNIAQYYTVGKNEAILPPNRTVAVIDPKTGKIKVRAERKELRGKLFDRAATGFFVLFIGLSVIFNAFIIYINTSTPGQIVSIQGVIPFIFQSSTMQPAIMPNDLAFFQKIDYSYPLEKGQIVLFAEDNVIYVERILEIKGNEVRVDIDYYPENSQLGALEKVVRRENIYGLYIGRSRWLGALILFANSVVGRLLFLFVPAVLLFYYGDLYKLIKRNRMPGDNIE